MCISQYCTHSLFSAARFLRIFRLLLSSPFDGRGYVIFFDESIPVGSLAISKLSVANVCHPSLHAECFQLICGRGSCVSRDVLNCDTWWRSGRGLMRSIDVLWQVVLRHGEICFWSTLQGSSQRDDYLYMSQDVLTGFARMVDCDGEDDSACLAIAVSVFDRTPTCCREHTKTVFISALHSIDLTAEKCTLRVVFV